MGIIVICVLAFLLYLWVQGNKPRIKGHVGEYKVKNILLKAFKNPNATVFNDITIRLNGDSTQIDHVVICEKGIFVIETKNYSGWIFGNERSKKWTQVIFKKKTSFQNPLHQNYKHIKFLESILNIDIRLCISLVVFTNKCEFKTNMPFNVIQSKNLKNFIYSNITNKLKPNEVRSLTSKLILSIDNNKFNTSIH
ncbi:Nuclease-related domain-containing protein [Flaviramulus basaltis]|uniref:Nuclease-related domain-containing protein n=1 Tax=Flaviramulus basaltis TaxID=369401 RepID=A0A1K2ICV2_9FLAO|nr:nuclease-related domain-containing protein [Flaviramulus basaltis]SFZ90253.1 Nuclease-related domain-containing protein [Flaviramulus basaltis]